MCRFREESLLELCAVSEENLYQNYVPFPRRIFIRTMCRFREGSLLEVSELCVVSEENLYQNYVPFPRRIFIRTMCRFREECKHLVCDAGTASSLLGCYSVHIGYT